MNDNLQFWAAWAQILSLLCSVISLVYEFVTRVSHRPNRIPTILKRILLYILIATVFFSAGILVNKPQKVSSSPPVSLISIGYEVNNFDPRRIDLRTASTDGIPVKSGQALRLFDLWFSSAESSSIYMVQAEIYANGKIIGSTPPSPLIAGQTKLGDVKIENFNHGSYPTSWNVQPNWTDLRVILVTYLHGKPVNRSSTVILLAADGTAWFIDPPNLSFVSIVYKVNDNQELVLDLRDAETTGFKAKPGDKLTLQEIWYTSNSSCPADCTAKVQVSLIAPKQKIDLDTLQVTPWDIVQQGIHKLKSPPLSWTIPSDKKFVVLILFRNDNTVLDMLILPLQ